jgi:hypothetical protein
VGVRGGTVRLPCRLPPGHTGPPPRRLQLSQFPDTAAAPGGGSGPVSASWIGDTCSISVLIRCVLIADDTRDWGRRHWGGFWVGDPEWVQDWGPGPAAALHRGRLPALLPCRHW